MRTYGAILFLLFFAVSKGVFNTEKQSSVFTGENLGLPLPLPLSGFIGANRQAATGAKKEGPGEAYPFLGASDQTPFCATPDNLSITNITNSGANISWTAAAATDFEYAVITSSSAPASGTLLLGTTTEFVSGLLPATYYYLHVRSKCGAAYSAWVTSEPFLTNNAPTGLITWVPSGQVNFGVSPWSATTADSRITVTGLTRGSGVQTATSGTGSTQAANDAWGGFGWAGADNQDIQFTVTAKTNYVLSLSSLQLSYRISSMGPTSALLSYAIGTGGFTAVTTLAFTTGNAGFTHPVVNLSNIPALQNLAAGTAVRFRILPAAAGTNTGTFYIFNEGLTINGSVASSLPPPVPNPVTAIYPTCFAAFWPAVAQATQYFMDVYQDGASMDPTVTPVAGWSFASNLAADLGIAANLGKIITVAGTNSPTISSGSARAISWTDGNGTKYWEISFSTANYYNLKLSSKQRSTNTGPRDFKVQYKAGQNGTYIDLPGGAVPPVADNYTSGILANLPLPAACENQATVYLRWIMTSNTAVGGAAVGTTGASNIDDILITGNQKLATTFVTGYNNKALGNATSVQVTGLAPLTKYYFVVRADAGGSTSNNSAPVTVTTTGITTTTYRSRQSGAWNSAATWEYEEGCGSWTLATAPPASTNNVLVRTGHTVTLATNAVVDNGKSLTIGSGGTLKTGAYFISGNGQFDLQAGGILSIGSPDGIEATGPTGAIRVTGTRSFSAGASYAYTGNGYQQTGNGLPATLLGTLTIANTGTAPGNVLTLSRTTSAASLVLQTPLALNGNALSATTISGTGSFTGSQLSSLSLGGGTFTLLFSQTTDSVSNALAHLAINGGTITLGNKLTIYGTLNLAGGTLNLAGKSVVLKSTAAGTARVAEIRGTLLGETAVTVERFIPQLSSRKWRLLTAPVTGTSINASWQEGQTFSNGIHRLTGTATNTSAVAGYGTLITGHGQGTSATAAGNGFDFWDAVATSASSLRRYAGAPPGSGAAWVYLANTTANGAFDQCQAYLLFVRGDRSVSVSADGVKATTLRATGTLRKGTQRLTLYGSAAQSHTLIGNPFASPLDFEKLYQANPGLIKRHFWLLNSAYAGAYGAYQLVYGFPDGTYQALPADLGTPDPAAGTSAAAVIHSGSAFFVEPLQAATLVNGLKIEESHKTSTAPGVAVFRQQDPSRAAKRLYINLSEKTSTGAQLLDGALALWEENSSGTSGGVAKMGNTGENLSILKNKKDLMVAMAAAPGGGDTVHLRLWNTGAKDYLLSIKPVGLAGSRLTAFLVDRYRQTQTPLSLAEGRVSFFEFSVGSDSLSRQPQRFYLVFASTPALNPWTITGLRVGENNGTALLTWRAEGTPAVLAYEVEKSRDGRKYSWLTTVAAKNGIGRQGYEARDSTPSPTTFYRVTAKNSRGDSVFSAVTRLVLPARAPGLRLLTGPTTGGEIRLQFGQLEAGLYQILVYNMAGQLLTQQTVHHPGGTAVYRVGLGRLTSSHILTVSVEGEKVGVESLSFRYEKQP